MRSRFSRTAAGVGLILLALTSCSQGGSDGTVGKPEGTQSRSSSEPPDIGPTAAPGVSFNYDYEFILPDKKIAGTQEAHAAACEKLGVARCRITGMRYSLSPDEETITASLSLKLAPEIARAFGKEALTTVQNNDGRLHNLEISGRDEDPTIRGGSDRNKLLAAQIENLRKQMANPDLDSDAKYALQQQINELEQQLQQSSADVSQAAERLANTPMTFQYYGRGGAPGFHGNPLREAWHLFIATGIALLAFLLRAVAVLVPFAVLLAIILLLWRSAPVRRIRAWMRPDSMAEASDGGDHPGNA